MIPHRPRRPIYNITKCEYNNGVYQKDEWTQFDIREFYPGIQTAQQTGNVTTQIGKYGTPQQIYKGSNGLTVVVETAGRNAGKVITSWWN